MVARRRTKGEGTIFFDQQKERWVAQLTLPTGKKKSKISKTQTEARKWLLEQRKAVQDNAFTHSDSLTVAAFMDRYYNDVASHTLRPKTLESYEYLIRMHIKPTIGAIKLSGLRADQLQKLYTEKLNEGLSGRTVHYIHQVLHKSFSHAVKWGLMVRNVTDLTEPPKTTKKDRIILTVEQSKAFLKQVKQSRFYPMYCLAFIGLREGEILGIHIEDFNREEKTLYIDHALQYLVGKGLVITEPKSKKSKRTIKLPEFVYTAMKDHCDRLEAKQGLMFTTANGTPFSPRNFFRDYQEQLEKAGLPQIRFHDLRHTAISFMINYLKIPPSVVRTYVGHSTAMLTLDVYTHTSSGMQEEAAEKMSRLFAETLPTG